MGILFSTATKEYYYPTRWTGNVIVRSIPLCVCVCVPCHMSQQKKQYAAGKKISGRCIKKALWMEHGTNWNSMRPSPALPSFQQKLLHHIETSATSLQLDVKPHAHEHESCVICIRQYNEKIKIQYHPKPPNDTLLLLLSILTSQDTPQMARSRRIRLEIWACAVSLCVSHFFSLRLLYYDSFI